MGLLLEGILLGLLLSILLGPIFIVMSHTAIEKGMKAGFTVASGVWFSDLLFIATSYAFISKISDAIQGEAFDFWMSLLGGLILCLFGIVAFLKKANFSKDKSQEKINLKSFTGFFSRGFLVNTVNPFTFIFWLGVMSTKVIGVKLSFNEAMIFLTGIMVTIIFTDSLKVLLSEMIRKILTEKSFNILSKIAGIGLLIFGVVMLYKGLAD